MKTDLQTETQSRGFVQRLVRQPRHKWFAAPEREREDGWMGPFETIDKAVQALACEYPREYLREGMPMFVGQGRKLSKQEREEMGVEYEWEVETREAFEIRLPNDQAQRPGPPDAEQT